MTRQTFSVVVSDRPMEAWLRQDQPPFVRVEVDPTETVVPGGVRIGVGFPVLEIAGVVKDGDKFATRIVDLLNGPDHGWSVEPRRAAPSVVDLIHTDGRRIPVNVDAMEIAALHQFPRPITLAVRDVVDERLRQRRDRSTGGEGWSVEHDNRHGGGELTAAAGVYALAAGRIMADNRESILPTGPQAIPSNLAAFWPWAATWWKPDGGVRRMLVKAAALIIAEIERLDRCGTTTDVMTEDQT